jgi:outer membrane protein TolC
MRKFSVRTSCLAAAVLTIAGTQASVFAQSQPAPAATPAPAGDVRRLTVDEAVRLALEQNLGVQIARLNPQVQDFTVAQARAGWSPIVTSSLATNSNTQVPNSVLAGGTGAITNDQVNGGFGVQQNLKWGTFYNFGWNSSRSSSSNIFTTFDPQLRSNLNLQVVQPLLRNFNIDAIRQQVLVGEKNRDAAAIEFEQTLASTSRAVRNAYYDLAYAIASLQVQRQSLELARESLRNNR